MLRAHVYCARRKEGRGKHTSGIIIWTGFCVRCRNIGSTNQIAVLGNQHKQHLNITCSKCTLDSRSGKSTAIVPARPCLLLTRLYRWQYPGPQVNYVICITRPKQELDVRHFFGGIDVFVSLPTGSDKSLCYCLLPRAFDFLRQRSALSLNQRCTTDMRSFQFTLHAVTSSQTLHLLH